jgi:hypothetical protein
MKMKGKPMVDWIEQGVSEAKAVRARLEKMSPSAGRRNFAGILNAMVADAAGKELPGLEALAGIRKAQRLGYRTAADHNCAHAKFAKAVAEGLNRLHPGKRASAAPVAASIIGEDDARSQRYTPDLSEAKRLLDAAGRLASGDPRARDHWPSGQVGAIAAKFLLDAARALVAAVRAQAEREAAEDVVAGRIPLAGRR